LNKDILTSLEKYSTWVLCNIFGCLIPIGVVALIGFLNSSLDLAVLFSSIMAFLFTILIISVYTYYPFASTRGEELLMFSSFIVSIIIIILFVLYNVIPNMQVIVNQKLIYWLLLLLIFPVIILLNNPAIQERIAKKKGTSVDKKLERADKKGQQWANKLTGGENK